MRSKVRTICLFILAICLLGGVKRIHGQENKSQSARDVIEESEEQQAAEGELLILLSKYRAAMEARSTERLAELVAPELSVLEGGRKNTGWADYRDHHIGLEMKEWKEFRITDSRVSEVSVSGDLGFAVQQATYTIVTDKGTVVLDGAESLVARKARDGWRLLHIHFSGKKREQAAPKP